VPPLVWCSPSLGSHSFTRVMQEYAWKLFMIGVPGESPSVPSPGWEQPFILGPLSSWFDFLGSHPPSSVRDVPWENKDMPYVRSYQYLNKGVANEFLEGVKNLSRISCWWEFILVEITPLWTSVCRGWLGSRFIWTLPATYPILSLIDLHQYQDSWCH
jgi:hypothetical protein